MDFSSASTTWGWIQRIALILGALASLIVIVEFRPEPAPTPQPLSPQLTPTPVPTPDSPSPTPWPPEPAPEEEIVYRTPSGKRYHRQSCQHVRGKEIPLSLAEAEERGITPCGTCNPDL